MKRVLSILTVALVAANLSGQATQSMSEQALSNESYARDATHFVGEYYGGGIIFYVEEDGKHGLITKTIEESKWQHGTFTDDYTVRDGVGTANFNRKRLEVIQNPDAYDAESSSNNPENSLGKWYLPTKYDMDKLYLNRMVVGGFSDFSKGWKSLETSSLSAWYQSFVVGVSFPNGKDDSEYIRIVREF